MGSVPLAVFLGPSPALDPFLTPTSGTWGLAFPDLALTFFFKPIPNDTGP